MKCLALTDKDSFGKYVFSRDSYDTSDKIVVASQPLASPTSSPAKTSDLSQEKTHLTYAQVTAITANQPQVVVEPLQQTSTFRNPVAEVAVSSESNNENEQLDDEIPVTFINDNSILTVSSTEE